MPPGNAGEPSPQAGIGALSASLGEMLLKKLKEQQTPPLGEVNIAFERPGDDFKPDSDTVDLFLYDIRENLELRSAEPTLVYLNGKAERRPPATRIACTYLVTAWPKSGKDLALKEHHMLSEALRVLAGAPTIPDDFLPSGLKDQHPPLPLVTWKTDSLKEPAEFWSALGGKMRPSFSVTATVGLEVFAPKAQDRLVSKPHVFEVKSKTDERFAVEGRVDADGAVVAGARVFLVEAGLSTTTGDDGRYAFSGVVRGSHTLRVKCAAGVREMHVTVPNHPNHYDVSLSPSSAP